MALITSGCAPGRAEERLNAAFAGALPGLPREQAVAWAACLAESLQARDPTTRTILQ